uniref:Putative peptidylglycine alpha-hydroxylating monooxygenase Y71G12B.4 n=1 Tax=Aceria tosichella TaxID=561515 RepID=A0A6G1S598_9ACAR
MGPRMQTSKWATINYKTFLVFLINFLATTCISAEQGLLRLSMPDVRPNHDESYLCVAHRLNPLEHEFIVGFQPNASAAKVHHILIYGCSLPGQLQRDTPNYVWECGEMNLIPGGSEAAGSLYGEGPVCANGAKTTILFGWALDAPAIELPPQVGFKIGGNSGINYLVLQVHYGNTAIFRSSPDITDNSGINLETVSGKDNNGITKLAGIYLLLSYGYVTQGVSKHTMECLIDEDKVIHPFRFRTHTHKLGTKVGGYRKPAGSYNNELELIGEHNPQEPQMFYPVEDKSMTISRGDRIYAYCDYNNTRDHFVSIGPTGNDEMCNFYMMYWTESGELLDNQDCMQYNP